MSARRPDDLYTIVVGDGGRAQSLGAPRSREDALRAFNVAVRAYPLAYHPTSGGRLRVMSLVEWQRVHPEPTWTVDGRAVILSQPAVPAQAGVAHYDASPSLRGCGAMLASAVGSAIALLSVCGFAFLPAWLAIAIPAALIVAAAVLAIALRRGHRAMPTPPAADERQHPYRSRQANYNPSDEELLDQLRDALRERGEEQDT